MSSPVSRLLKFVAALPVLAYACVVGLMVYKEPQLLFHPPERNVNTLSASAASLGAREVRLTTRDGVGLYGWRLRTKSDRAVLYFSGNGSSVGDASLLYQRFQRAGLNVLHVNYRGYPGSSGEPSEEGLIRDAEAAWELLREEFEADEITIVGHSLGGGVATALAVTAKPRALVLLSTFTSAVNVAQETYPWVPVDLLMKNRFESVLRAPKVGCRTLIVHGTRDTIIPPHHAEGLASAFPEPPEVIWVEGAGHNDDLLGEPEALEALLQLAK